jgi:osmotically-inducible protein OsmY
MIAKADFGLRQVVLQELTWDPLVEELSIGVSVENGVVTLTGVVSHDAKRRVAEVVARRVAGVRAVINQIRVDLRGD